jgi:hypothetical protein
MSQVYLVQFSPSPDMIDDPPDDCEAQVVSIGYTETRVAVDMDSARAIAAEFRGDIARVQKITKPDTPPLTWKEEIQCDGAVVVWESSAGHHVLIRPAEQEVFNFEGVFEPDDPEE